MVYERVQKAAAWSPQHHTQMKKQEKKIQPLSDLSSRLSAQERIDSLPDVPANWMSLDPVMRRIQAKAAAMQLASSQETGDSSAVDTDAVQMKCSQCEEKQKVQLHADGEVQPRSDDSHEQVQLYANGQTGAKSIQQVATEGFSGSATTLPHLNQIQQSFGVNLSHVQAYIGGDAAAACQKMGADAYASGNQIAFKEAPSVELAAHEAAHVVQQASGKVQLSGGVGKVGDKYEQHADDVAARVGTGQSAGDLLAEYTGNTAQNSVQVKSKETSLQAKSETLVQAKTAQLSQECQQAILEQAQRRNLVQPVAGGFVITATGTQLAKQVAVRRAQTFAIPVVGQAVGTATLSWTMFHVIGDLYGPPVECIGQAGFTPTPQPGPAPEPGYAGPHRGNTNTPSNKPKPTTGNPKKTPHTNDLPWPWMKKDGQRMPDGVTYHPGRIELRYKPVAFGPVTTPAQHGFVVVTSPFVTTRSGAVIGNFYETHYRGGPSGPKVDSSNPNIVDWGYIKTLSDRYDNRAKDWTVNPTGFLPVRTDLTNEQCTAYRAMFKATMTAIQSARIAYGLPNIRGGCGGKANSNSTAHQAIRQAGLGNPSPPVFAPCWEINPFEAQPYNGNMANGGETTIDMNKPIVEPA